MTHLYFEDEHCQHLLASIKQKLRKLDSIHIDISEDTQYHELTERTRVAIECGQALQAKLDTSAIPKEILKDVAYISVDLGELNGFFLQYLRVKQDNQQRASSKNDSNRKRGGLSSTHPRS